MKILVTGSSGHLGEALVRTLRDAGHAVTGIDILESAFTTAVGSIADRDFVHRSMQDVEAVLHAATLHKPHVVTHGKQLFVDTNITGTLNLLEESVSIGVRAFVFTSTTSAFGRALTPPPGAPAAWVTESVIPVPRNIYGVTKVSAEDLCELFYKEHGLRGLVLRTSRFFPEEDDRKEIREAFSPENAKANEFLHRRVDIEDVVDAHVRALERIGPLGFGRYIISATTPFTRDDLAELRTDAPAALARRAPGYEAAYARRGWRMFPGIDRVYDNERARRELGWQPRYDFAHIVRALESGQDPQSPLARLIGSRGYHPERFDEGPYPTD